MNTNHVSKVTALMAAVCAGAISSAHAQFTGTSTGIFDNPVGGADNPTPVTTGIGTSSMTFGDPDDFGTGPNALAFTGAAFAGVPAETLFPVGSLYYFNGTTVLGSNLDKIGLDIELLFTVPGIGSKSFDFPLTITTTPNTGTQAQNADYVTLPAASSTTFTVGLETYTLDLSFGEFTGGGYLAPDGSFHVYEDDSATAPVFGDITTNLEGVPDSGSTMLFLGGASALLGWARRK
jgi:hypothetical protein